MLKPRMFPTMGRDPFWHEVLSIALPITLQSVIMASLHIADQLMIGQLGDDAIAAVGITSKITMFVTILLVGLTGGLSVYAAQFWGKGDRGSIKKLLGFGISAGGIPTVLYSLFVCLLPAVAIGIFTTDANVVATGEEYLQIIAWSYPAATMTMVYSSILRSTKVVRLPMVASIVAALVNIGLNYVLIFGHAGFAPMGLKGAAIATCSARMIEMLIIVAAVYAQRLPAAGTFSEIFSFNRPFIQRVWGTTYPIVLSELLWVSGETTYGIIYGRMGTEEMAAMTITFPLQGLSIGLLSGLSGAARVLIGNKLGANEQDAAFDYAKRFIRTGVGIALVAGMALIALSPFYVSLYNTSSDVATLAGHLVLVFAIFLWVKVGNMIVAGGVLHSGGDSKFVFAMESTATWLVGVPSGLLFAFVWGMPLYWVYFALSTEEIVRFVVGLVRVHSHRWVHNLIDDIHEACA